MGSAIEPPQWHLVGRVELVQMPAQPLLGPSALIDEIVAMIDQQLDLPVDLLALPRPAQVRLAQCRTRDRERVDRVRLAARPASAPARAPSAFGGTRSNCSPTLRSCRSSQPVSCRQSSTAHSRCASSLAAQPSSSSLPTTIAFSASGRPAPSTATAVTDCLCTSNPITIICIASKPLAATGERTDLTRGQRPRPYQVTLDGLGRRRRHNAGKSD